MLLALLASLGPAIWAAAIIVKYRDFRFVIPFVLQFGLYLSPVGFESAIVPEQWRLLYNLNPMVGIIDGFRWCIVGGASPIYLPGFVLSLVVTAGFLARHHHLPPHRARLCGPDLKMSEPVIRVENLGKKFVIGHKVERDGLLRDAVARGARSMLRNAADLLKGRPLYAGDHLEEFWALQGLNFEIKPGELVSIIGSNGAGKIDPVEDPVAHHGPDNGRSKFAAA